MATKLASWQLEQQTLILKGAWLRDQVAATLPLLPNSVITCIDMQGVTQLDSSLMTVLLRVHAQSQSVCLCGVSAQVASLLTLYRLDGLFSQTGADCVV